MRMRKLGTPSALVQDVWALLLHTHQSWWMLMCSSISQRARHKRLKLYGWGTVPTRERLRNSHTHSQII